MAFDGFVISNLVNDMKTNLIGGRITKISQPEKDEIILTIKNYNTYKLDISVSASLPLMYFINEAKPAPLTAPAFTMLLRKHLNSARIMDIIQPEMERVIQIKIEHLDELGDLKIKWLMIELMGKHSNIIFTDDEMRIIDSIKHISAMVSSVREVLPNREYFIPKTTGKIDFSTCDEAKFVESVLGKNGAISKAIYTSFTGFSPLIANEICIRAAVDPAADVSAIENNDLSALYEITTYLFGKIDKAEFTPNIILKNNEPVEFSCFDLKVYDDENYEIKTYDTISEVLSEYYYMKDKVSRISQKSASLRKLLSNAVERVSHKYDIQSKQIESTLKRDKYKIYGELITTYGYSVEEGSKSMTCINYYDGEEVTIPLDDSIPVMSNAKKYFDRYAKLKRTFEAASEQLEQSKEELEHLLSIQAALDIALYESDLSEIRKELMDFGYIKKTYSGKDKKDKRLTAKSKPLHYVTPDGFHLYVGKNNYQNDELTFKFATGNDWWFHAKKSPGSHVILKTEGREVPDDVFEKAAALAAYYSSLKSNDKVEIDYLQKKNVKKPNNAKPGFVVYYTNYSLIADTDISALTLVNE